MSRGMRWVVGAFAVLMGSCGLVTLGPAWLVTGPFYLVFGWVPFLMKVLPRVHWRWDALAEALLVAGLLGGGAHLFLRRLWRGLHANAPDARPWPVRWSASLLALLVLLFVATMATVGAAHHVGWLASSQEPLVVSSFFRTPTAENTEQERLCGFALLQVRAGVTPEQLPRVLLASTDTQDAAERMFVVASTGPQGEVDVLVFPRDPEERDIDGGVRCGVGRHMLLVSPREVTRWLSTHGPKPGP